MTWLTGVIIVIALGPATAVRSVAGGPIAGPGVTVRPLAPQFQRDTLQLQLRQSQAAQGVQLDATTRLQFEQLRSQQLREQQVTQERQQRQHVLLEQQVRLGAAPPAALLSQEQLFGRERQQQQQRFDLELNQWRLRQESAP